MAGGSLLPIGTSDRRINRYLDLLADSTNQLQQASVVSELVKNAGSMVTDKQDLIAYELFAAVEGRIDFHGGEVADRFQELQSKLIQIEGFPQKMR